MDQSRRRLAMVKFPRKRRDERISKRMNPLCKQISIKEKKKKYLTVWQHQGELIPFLMYFPNQRAKEPQEVLYFPKLRIDELLFEKTHHYFFINKRINIFCEDG